MRCDCCNKLLNDFEATRKSAITGDYINTCNSCLKGLDIATVDRADLNPYEYVSDFDEEDEDYSLVDDNWEDE